MSVTYSKENIERANSLEEFASMEGLKDFSNWSDARRKVAEEQFKYLKAGIEVGAIDGYDGPQTKYARSVYDARQKENKLVETWRDLPMEDISPAKFTNRTWPNRNKWPKQNESSMNQFFGAVGTNQVQAKMPFEMVVAWDPRQKVREFSCNRLVKEPIERIFNRTLEYYGYEKIVNLRLHYFGGCFNVRKMRGGSAWSVHSWGCAVDIDPERNDLNTPWKDAELSKPAYDKFWEFVYDEGAISLGIERNFDAMHFQFAQL